MATRFEETVNIRQVDTSTGFAAASNSLLSRLNQFSTQATGLARKAAVQKGIDEAQQVDLRKKDGLTQAPETREVSFGERILSGNITQNAYNKTLKNAYMASIGNDVRERIKGIESENPDNIVAFNEQVARFTKGVIGGVDQSARQEVQSFIDGQVSNARARVHDKAIKKNKAEAAAEIFLAINAFSDDSASLSREGNQLGAAEAIAQAFTLIDGMVDSGDMRADVAAIKKREIEREASEQVLRKSFDELANSKGLEVAFNELEAISNKPATGWTPDEWDNFVASEQADLRQKAVRIQQSKAKNNLEISRQISNLKIQINTGIDLEGNELDPSKILGEIEGLFNSGAVSESERSSMITSIIKKQQADADLALKKQKVALRISGNTQIAVTQDEIDLTWEEDISLAVAEMPLVLQNTAIAQFVDATKIIPTEVKRQVTSNLNSEDPLLVANSADLMDRLDDVRGIPENNFSPTDRAYAESVVGLMKNMDPLEAIKLARQNTNPNDKGRIDARKFTIKDDKLPLEYPGIIKSEFAPFFGFVSVDQVSQGQLTREYSVLFEQHFLAGMSQNSAKEKALQILKRNWGETNVTGKAKAIKYPPEDYYAVNGSVDYIGRDLFTSVVDQNVGLPEFKREDIILISDQTTARESAGGNPSYMVMINMGDQGLMPLIGFRYLPDMQKQIDKVKKENEKRVTEGRKPISQKDIFKSFDKLRSF